MCQLSNTYPAFKKSWVQSPASHEHVHIQKAPTVGGPPLPQPHLHHSTFTLAAFHQDGYRRPRQFTLVQISETQSGAESPE